MDKRNSDPATKAEVKQIVSDAVGELATMVKHGFDGVYKEFSKVYDKFDEVDKKFDRIDHRFIEVDKKFDRIDHRFIEVDKKFDRIDHRFIEVDEHIKESEERIMRHFDVVAENIHLDVAGANKDEISLIQQKQAMLEERVTVVEEKVGV